jgi:hypothetical protein
MWNCSAPPSLLLPFADDYRTFCYPSILVVLANDGRSQGNLIAASVDAVSVDAVKCESAGSQAAGAVGLDRM